MVEAGIGQVFIATTLASLVSLSSPAARPSQPAHVDSQQLVPGSVRECRGWDRLRSSLPRTPAQGRTVVVTGVWRTHGRRAG